MQHYDDFNAVLVLWLAQVLAPLCFGDPSKETKWHGTHIMAGVYINVRIRVHASLYPHICSWWVLSNHKVSPNSLWISLTPLRGIFSLSIQS